MAKKRVHELAKIYDLPSKEVLKRLTAAGIEVKAAASAVDEHAAEAAITGKAVNGAAANGKARTPEAEKPAEPAKPIRPSRLMAQQAEQAQAREQGANGSGGKDGAPRQRPTRSSLQG
ncbi:MAG: translation initiation factor IF-2 N-terminal domain-containing protein, partial [Actinomycetota bacterium]|nr:translation initiation factor IF-2 N-terminal domain-containing protein [Actinomycetota bacterium]